MKDTLNIGIIRLSSLGDCVVSVVFLPSLIATLQKHHIKAHITWFVDSKNYEILADSPCIDEFCILPKGKIFAWYRILKKKYVNTTFDILIDMQGLFKSAFVGALLKKSKFIGFSFSGAREKVASFFYSHRVKIPYDEHILKRNFALIKCLYKVLNISKVDSLESALSQREKAFMINHIQKIQDLNKKNLASKDKKILFILEASYEAKTYAQANFANLLNLIADSYKNVQFYLLTHMRDDKARDIIDFVQNKERITHISHQKLINIKSIIASMDLVIGGDTGITHLAWALNRPSITLYGNTPQGRVALSGKYNVALSGASDLKKQQSTRAQKTDFSINNISPDSIFALCEQILGK